MPPSSSLNAARELLASTDYELVSLLARGGMADVYRVEHRFLGRSFALKLLHQSVSESPGFVDRLLLEARVLGRLESRHIVEIVDLWVNAAGTPLLVLELLEGHTLAERLETVRQLPLSEALEWTLELLDALDEAHGNGLVHRDLKPTNLFLHHAQNFTPTLKVLDFGLARVIAEHASTTAAFPALRTTTGAVVGSPSYLSPEALRGERVDARADLFAAGLILYEMVCGVGAFERGASMIPPRDLRPALTDSLEALLERALAQDPSARFQTAFEFAEAVRRSRETLHRDDDPDAP